MKILVTGGAGYIGSVLVPMLLKEHVVTVVDNFRGPYSRSSLLGNFWNQNLEVVEGDARDRKLMSRLIEGSDVILPLAALVGVPTCDSDVIGAETTNLGAISTMLSLCDAQKIIFPCTNSGYGIGQKDIYCTEETPMRPISLYGKLKVEAEGKVIQSGNAISLRLATVFGLSSSPRIDLLVNSFVYKAVHEGYIVLFEGHFKRNYIHVYDVARAFLHSLDNFEKMRSSPVYNVGLSEANLDKQGLCEEIKKQLPDFQILSSPMGQDPDKRDYIVSNDKIEATCFKPKVNLQQGISELIRGYKVLIRGSYRYY